VTEQENPQFTKPELILRLVDLPEAELLRRDLERELLASTKGSAATKKQTFPTIRNIEVEGRSAIPNHKSIKDFTKRVLSKKITKIARQGRLIFLLLEAKDTPNQVLVLDFDSGGLLRLCKPREAVAPETVAIFGLGGLGQLRFLETKVGAQMYVVPQSELTTTASLLQHMGLEKMGLDPLRQSITWQSFYELCNSTQANRKGVKSLLCDEKFVLGVGDIYSDEILFHAELNYRREAGNLTATEARRFCRALTGTLHDALKQRGTSIVKRPFLDLHGEPGSFGDHLEVFMRKGELSSRGGTVVSSRFSSRTTYYCDKTQMLREL